jgi:phosphoribosyl 1,2-cyclic phosphodiesterase
MRVRFWGVRGSVPVPNSRMLRYGGNTSCVEVTLADGTRIVLDAGTGIRELAASAAPAGSTQTQLLLTHLHLDHIQGLLFFAPLFDPANEITVYGPPAPGPNLDQRLARYLSAPLSPVDLRELPARVEFAACPHGEWQVGSARVQAAIVAHRGMTLGYRITDGDSSLCYLPDHEPALGTTLAEADPEWISGMELAAGASVLIHDGQYAEAEYAKHVGWGHSSVSDAVTFARHADAERLIIFHHDPEHDDDELDALTEHARAGWVRGGGDPDALSLAEEGMIVDL